MNEGAKASGGSGGMFVNGTEADKVVGDTVLQMTSVQFMIGGLTDVVEHYDATLGLALDSSQKGDLVEFLRSL